MTALNDALTALAQEPWCWHPDQIARLTDRQVLAWYIEPAAERARNAERARKGLPPEAPKAVPAPPSDEPPPRAAVVGVMHHVLGLSVAEANRRYDEQLAEFRRQKAGANADQGQQDRLR